MKSWRQVPLAIRVATIAGALVTLSSLVMRKQHDFEATEKVQLATMGTAFAVTICQIAGMLELVKLLHGRTALGARLAAAGSCVSLGLSLVSLVARIEGDWMHDHASFFAWTWFAIYVVTAFGLALAASRNVVAGIAVFVLLVAVSRPPPLEHWLFEHFRDNFDTLIYLNIATRLVNVAVFLVAALFAVSDLPAGFTIDEAQRARLGHERMANAMWLRIVGLCSLPLMTVMIIGGDGRHADKILGGSMIFGAALGVLSLAWFGVGALDVVRSRHAAARPAAYVTAAFASLWCAGVTLHQIPDLYDLMVGHETRWGRDFSFAQLFPYLLPLVAGAALVFGALAMGGFATRREHLELGARGERCAVVVGLMELLAIGTTSYLVPEARSTSSMMLLTLMALTFGLIAIVSLARLARDAAYAVELAPPQVPTAQLM